MSQDAKKTIVQEIENRIGKLTSHRDDRIAVTGNQYEELNQAVSKVIGTALLRELEDLRSFAQEA